MTQDIIVIGAGPAGLSCAIEAQRAGLSVTVLEQGSVVDAIRRFPTNLVWFSTPEQLAIGDIPFVIPTTRPTRVDTLNYYRSVAVHYHLNIRLHDAVVELEPADEGFRLVTASGAEYTARRVVIATGYFDHPQRLGVPGEDAPHVRHYYDEPFNYGGTDVVVVGGRNSAVEAALDLYRHGARVTLVHRGPALSPGVKYWILPDIENRLKAGQIRGLFETTVSGIEPSHVRVRTPVGDTDIQAAYVFILVGFLPDSERLRVFGVELDPVTLAPRCDPETLETTIPGLFVAGSVVAGRDTNKIFVENGRDHGKVIVRAILGKEGRIS